MSLSEWRPFLEKIEGSFQDLKGGGEVHGAFRQMALPGVGESLLQRAVLEAQAIVDEARAHASQIEKEAFEKGFAQGEKAGKQIAEKAMEATLKALDAALAKWQKEELKRSWEKAEEIVRLALAVARKILKREVKQDPSVIVDIVRDALSKTALREEVIIKVHPMDRETLMEARGDLLRELDEVRSLRIEADDKLSRGDALIECPQGELDLRIERQLSEIERAFEALLVERRRDCLDIEADGKMWSSGARDERGS